MDISAIAVQTTPTDPASLLGEDSGSPASGGFAALLAQSARQLGQAGLQSLSVHNMAMMQNIQIAPPPSPPPMPAAPADLSPPPAPLASSPPTDPASQPSAQATAQSATAQQANARPARTGDDQHTAHHTDGNVDHTATQQISQAPAKDQTASSDDSAKGQQASQPAGTPSNATPQQTAQTSAAAQDATAATEVPTNDPTLLADVVAQTAPTPGPATPAAGIGPKASPMAGDGKSTGSAKTATGKQDDLSILAAASMAAPPPVAPVATASANSAQAGTAGLTAAGSASPANGGNNAGATDADGSLADPRLLAGRTPATLHTTPAAAAGNAAANANGKAQTATTGQAAADSAAFDPTNGASAQNAATPTTQAAAAQAQKLSQLAGQTGVTVTVASPAGTQGLPPQSVSALAPADAVLFDPTAQTGPHGDGKTFGGFSGDTGQPPTNQPAPVAGTMLFSLTPLSTLTNAAQMTAAVQAAAQAAPQAPEAIAGSPTDLAARLTTPILTEATGVAASAGAGAGNATPLPQTASLGGPAGLAVPAQSAADDAAPTAPTNQASQPEEPAPLDQLKVQIDKGIKSGNDTINVQLRPDDLGRVEIKLEVQNGDVKATVTADKPETLQLLKNDAPVLQQALHDAGLNADSTALSFQLRGEQQQQRQTGQNSGRANRRVQDVSLSADDTAPATAMNMARSRLQSAGGVDINV